MGRNIPFDDVRDSSALPAGTFGVQLVSVESTATKPKDDDPGGKLMYRVVLAVTDGPFAQFPIYDYLVVGTKEDPEATERKTWFASGGAVRLKELTKACGLPFYSDEDQLIQALEGQKCVAEVTAKDGRNNVRRYHSVEAVVPTNGEIA